MGNADVDVIDDGAAEGTKVGAAVGLVGWLVGIAAGISVGIADGSPGAVVRGAVMGSGEWALVGVAVGGV